MEPITLITGLPGHGKTLKAMQLLDECRAEGLKCYQYGIDDCDPNVAELWEPGPARWFDMPENSVLVVDEAHEHLPKPGKGEEPEWITRLAKIRHDALRLILITQDPRSIHHFVRRRVGVHYHIERKTGHEVAVVWTFAPVADNPQDHFVRKKATKAVWRYPKKYYGHYTSAKEHLVRKRIPFKFLLLPLSIIVLVWAIYRAYVMVMGGDEPVVADVGASMLGAATGLSPTGLAGQPQQPSPWSSVEAFQKAHTPLIAGIPWSAPIFADRKPVTTPELHCIITGDVDSYLSACRCYSEQVTRIEIDPTICREVARNGVYNPYRPVHAVQPSSGPGQPMGTGRESVALPAPSASLPSSVTTHVQPVASPPPNPFKAMQGRPGAH